MSPAQSTQAAVRAEKDQRVRTILKFCQSLSSRLNSGHQDNSLFAELLSYLPSFPLKPASDQRAECDAQGTGLWNLSTRLNRIKDGEKQTICLLRVFAFYLLDSSNNGKDATWPNCIRILKVAMRASKMCIECLELVWGTKLLERTAYYIEQLEKYRSQLTPEDSMVQNRLRMEYLVLRVLLAWKQAKLDVAEHMYQKIDTSQLNTDPVAAEELVDALYEIGKDLYDRKQFEMAVRWLERANDLHSDQQLEKLSDTSSDLRMSTMHLLTKALLATKMEDSLNKAQNLVELMETEYGDKLLVSLLKLELLSQLHPDPTIYYGVLLRMFHTIMLTGPNFKTVMYHIHKLRRLAPDLGCKAVDDLLHIRLFESDTEEWIEKAALMRIWITTSSATDEAKQRVASLRAFLDEVSRRTKHPFTPAATHAAQTLIWKSIEEEYIGKQFDSAEALCRLAAHSLFNKCGENNRAKLARKIMHCALARVDFVTAREAFFAMSDVGQASSQSRFLLYKVAVRTGDDDLASECLEAVCQSSSKDANLLYACVLEAQQVGQKRHALAALHKVLKKYQHGSIDVVHLPALLRCTARLMKSELDFSKPLEPGATERFCDLFEGAAAQAHKSSLSKSTTPSFNRSEFEWFSRNIYNLSLEICADAHPLHLSRLACSCIRFIELLLPDTEGEKGSDLRLRRVLCEYLALAANIVLARAEESTGLSCQYYLTVRKHSQTLRQLIPQLLESGNFSVDAASDLKAKFVEAVKYELEAVLRLRNWDDLDLLFQECWKYEEDKRWETLADLGFVINEEIVKAGLKTSHQAKVLVFIQKIINHSFRYKSDITNVARWLRCLYRISTMFDQKIALQCIDHAISMAQKCRTPPTFPALEIEWFATTAFNHAIDFYVASDDVNCKLWAEKALTLAGLVDDKGLLLGLLQGKYSELRWNEQGLG